ncbi:imm11 family protein [Mucilaginibacter sp. Mucisp86]|uniref:imm11 family protein n=1 Tax=Mucilaginibacter sp. Mucisp86 TaxID=3243060 RepID=UPI0039B4BEAC
MNISDFYTTYTKFSSKTFHTEPVDTVMVMTRYDDLIKGDFKGIKFPLKFQQHWGNKLLDILNTGTPSLYLISNKLKTLLQEKQVTGWTSFEIELLDKKGLEVKGYYGFSVTGRCGPADENKSEIITKHFDSGFINHYRKGLYIGLDQWNGSDFFYPDGTSHLITTKRVVDILIDYKISNVQFENLTEIEMMIL